MSRHLGCFPCAYRLILAILITQIPIFIYLVKSLRHSDKFKDVINREAPFPIVKKESYFSGQSFDFSHPNTSEPLRNALNLMLRRGTGETTTLVLTAILCTFTFIQLVGAFALRKKACTEKSISRCLFALYYMISGIGYIILMALSLGETLHVNALSLVKDMKEELSTLKKKGGFLYLRNGNTLSAEQLEDIVGCCYMDLRNFELGLIDFHHVYVNPTVEVVLPRLGGEWYQPEVLEELGLCQLYHGKIIVGVLLGVVGWFSVAVPIVAASQRRSKETDYSPISSRATFPSSVFPAPSNTQKSGTQGIFGKNFKKSSRVN